MEQNKYNIDDRLWEYIDGLSSPEERISIEKLLDTNQEWKETYDELLEVHRLVHSSALEEPSLRFTRNVMEEIAKYHICASPILRRSACLSQPARTPCYLHDGQP